MAKRNLDEFYWQLGTELQRMGDELTSGKPAVARSRKWRAKADVAETDRAIYIKVELAGVRPEAIRVTLNRRTGRVTIRGERRDDVFEGLGVAFHQLEISYGDFECDVHLPMLEIDPNQVRVQYAQGFLLVELPKASEDESVTELRRTITIRQI